MSEVQYTARLDPDQGPRCLWKDAVRTTVVILSIGTFQDGVQCLLDLIILRY